MKPNTGYYNYWPYQNRPKIVWPNGAQIALWVAPNIEFYELNPPLNPQRSAWPQPNPAVLGYSTRDYGNRVGHTRLMAVLNKYNIRGSISLSTALCQHHPEIIQLCNHHNWEFFSHGIYNTRYTYGMSEAQEKEMIIDSIATIKKYTNQNCAGYLAPALSHSELTLDLFAEAGGIYTCDLFHDDQPTPITLRSGKKFVSIPYSLEMNDTIAYVVNKITPRQYGQIIKDNFDQLYAEGATSGTVMCIPLHNYQVSHPHRLAALDNALAYITNHPNVWCATGKEIAEYYLANYYDQAIENIKEQNHNYGIRY